MTFYTGPQLAGNLYDNSIRPGRQYGFEVSLQFSGIDGGSNPGDWGWVRQIGLDNWGVSAPVWGGMSEDTQAPQAGEIQNIHPVAAGVFDSGATFTVTASDNVLLQGGQFFWRKSGTDQWSVNANPTAAAAEGGGVTFTVDFRTLFGSTALTRDNYDIRFLGVDWAGRTVDKTVTLRYGTLDAPTGLAVAVQENTATVTWDPVYGAASYRIYVDGRAVATAVTDPHYIYYMEPYVQSGSTYVREEYTFAVAAVTAGGGEGERAAYGQVVRPDPDETEPTVTGVTDADQDGVFRFSITGFDNGRVGSYSWQILPAGTEDAPILLEGTQTDKHADGTAIRGPIHGEATISEWLDTKDVLQNQESGRAVYAVRSFPGGSPDETYFTRSEEDGTYTLRDGGYRLRVVVYDTAGHPSVAHDHLFQVSNVGPDLPEDFQHGVEVSLAGSPAAVISWDPLEEGSPGVRLWYPGGYYGACYDSAEERDAAAQAVLNGGAIPAGFQMANYPTGTSQSVSSLRDNKYYFYGIAAYNAAGVAGILRIGTFDTCFTGKTLEAIDVTYNGVSILEDGGTNLVQGGTLSVTVTADFIRGGSAVLCRTENGEAVRLTNAVSFIQQPGGGYAATLTCSIPDGDFSWSGPQEVYVQFNNSSYSHIRTVAIPVNLKTILDEEPPTLNSVDPAPGVGISGRAFEFALNATDNSNVIAGAQVQWKYAAGGDDQWQSVMLADDAFQPSASGGTVTVRSARLSPDTNGNIMLRFTVTDGAGRVSNAMSGSYALANEPIAAPTGLHVTAGERRITLTWSPVLRLDTAGYHIYRAVDSGAYVQVGTVGTGQNSFTDTDNGGYLDPTKAYSYQVAAYSDAHGEGEQSVATGWLHPYEQTDAPTILSLEPWQGSAFRSPVEITVKVEDAIEVNEVKLEYAYLGTSSLAEPDSTTRWHGIHTFEEGELDAGQSGTTYTLKARWELDAATQTEGWFAIRVTARNHSEKTAVSTVKCRYDNQAPNQVTGLSATDEGSGGAIRLNFTASSSPDVQKYRIYRAEGSSEFAQAGPIGETAAEAYRDSGCQKGKTYCYWVTAVDRAGNESQATGPVQATAGAVCDVSVTQPPVLRDSVLTAGRASTIAVSVLNAGPARAGGTLTLAADYGSGPQTVGTATFGEDAGYALLRAGEAREVLFTMDVAEGTSVTLTATFSIDGNTATDTKHAI